MKLPLQSHGHGNGPLDQPDDLDDGLMPAHPAATLIVYHEGTGAERSPVLMVRRATTMSFAAGAAVFPGGRVDEDDYALAAALPHSLDTDDAAARIAAIRETIEETGLPIGVRHRAGDAGTEMVRNGLHAGELFSRLLADVGGEIEFDALVAFSRWRPNFQHSRLFDTRFYVARISGALPPLSVSDGENSHLFWIDPGEALVQSEAEQLHIIFPTRRNLERLALARDFDGALSLVSQFPAKRIIPFVADVGGTPHLCIREDCGYPITSEAVTSALR